MPFEELLQFNGPRGGHNRWPQTENRFHIIDTACSSLITKYNKKTLPDKEADTLKASVSTYSRLMIEIVIHALSPDIPTNDHLASLFSSLAIVTLAFASISCASPDAISWVPGLEYRRGKIEDFHNGFSTS